MEFSDIALTKFLKTFPELANMILTFFDMTDQLPEDKNIQFGVFVLNAGGEQVFVPVIARGETVYPIDQVFLNDENKFFPLTPNFVQVLANSQKYDLGKAKKIPQTVDQNPSVQKMINPPRTGKFVYASTGRLLELLGMLPDVIKRGVKEVILSSPELQTPLHRFFGLPEMMEAVQVEDPPQEQETVTETPVQFAMGNNVPEWAVQDVLRQGYAILGEQKFPRVVTPQVEGSNLNCNIQQVSQSDAGRSFCFLMKDGSTLNGTIMENFTGSQPSTYVFLEDGSMANLQIMHKAYQNPLNNRFVVLGTSVEPGPVVRSFLESNPPSRLENVMIGQEFVLISDNRVMGTFEAIKVTQGDGVKVIQTRGPANRIVIPLGAPMGSSYSEGNTLYCNRKAVVIPKPEVTRFASDFETSLRNAENILNYKYSQVLPESMSIIHDNGEFSINGSRIGAEPDLMRVLVVDERIPALEAQNIVKEAKERSHCKLFLSKKADVGEGDTEPGVEQFGETPPPQDKVWGTRDFKNNVSTAIGTNDRQVVEASVISELLQDPNMYETISSYLPDVAEAIDKLGRTLLLVRVNSADIFGENGSNTLTALLGSVRNTYRMLGDNYLKLERLIANEPDSDE